MAENVKLFAGQSFFNGDVSSSSLTAKLLNIDRNLDTLGKSWGGNLFCESKKKFSVKESSVKSCIKTGFNACLSAMKLLSFKINGQL